MKQLVWTVIAVLAVCMALCGFSQWGLNGILDEAHEMTVEVFTAMEEGELETAKERLVALATLWDENAGVMELLCDHDDVHEVKERIIQARICVDYTDLEEFYSAVALIGEGIEHIRDKEGLRGANLLQAVPAANRCRA